MNVSTEKLQARLFIALIFALPFVSYLMRLGGAPMFDIDEGAFSEATREMFERGNFLFTYLNDEPRFDKPILVYWFMAIGYAILGLSEWAFRLPSAISAILWCFATWYFARKRLGKDAALVALAINATALGPFIIGRAATADGLLNLLLALALFDAWRHLESGQRAPLLRSFVWIGLGFLTKGPIAFLVPGAVTFLYCASKGQWLQWVRAVFDPKGWIILLALIVPWYAVALIMHGWDFIDGFFIRHNVERFSSTLHGHAGGFLYYAVAIPFLLLPWSGPFFATLRRVVGDYRSDLHRFLWFWAGFVFIFFTLSGTKLPHYMLYGATPLFLLIAAHHEKLKSMRLHAIAPTLLLAALPVMPVIFWLLSQSNVGNEFFREHLAFAVAESSFTYYLLTLGGLALWIALLLRWHSTVTQKLVAAATIQVLVLSLAITPWFGAVLQQPVKDAALMAKEMDTEVVRWRYTVPSFSLYREAVTHGREPKPGEVAVTRTDRLPEDLDDFDILYQRGAVTLLKRLEPVEEEAEAVPLLEETDLGGSESRNGENTLHAENNGAESTEDETEGNRQDSTHPNG